ncbi:MAG: radical SAM protein [Termitinemataceae bacterium]|nr:MAG: radical SAM protein [Termitinemataceae bacterium]
MSLSAWLKKYNYKPLLIDANSGNLGHDDILARINEHNIQIVGISCITSTYSQVVSLSRFLKEKGKNVIVGGIHPSFLPYQTLVDTGAEYVLCGEGEIPLLKLLEKNMVNDGIKGVYSLDNLKDADTQYQMADVVSNLDDIPMLDWEQLPPLDSGCSIETTRGCSNSCKFCVSKSFNGRKVRMRSPQRVVEEMLYLKEKFNVKSFGFVDDSMTLNKERVAAICNLMLEHDLIIPWSCFVRADQLDDDTIELMKKTGLNSCGIGVESANDEILKNINKDESVDEIRRGIEMLLKHNLNTNLLLIIGLPGETKKTIKKTIDFTLSFNAPSLLTILYNQLQIVPGSELWNDLKGMYQIVHSTHCDMKLDQQGLNTTWTPQGLTHKDLKWALYIGYARFYLRPAYFFAAMKRSGMRNLIMILKGLFN